MDLDLSGKLALVTGSTRGIGLAAAKGLAAMGADVIVNGRERPAVLDAIAQIARIAPKAKLHPAPFDLGGAAGCAGIIEHFGEVDILVNNLGIYERKPAFEITDEEWHRLFEVNVMSGVRFARHYAPQMAKAGWGRVLFVSSESALNIPREMIHYGMTKTAQLSIARGLAMELEGTGVTVNSLLPGPTRTVNTEK
ncbi:MAG TPA: SDR family oxidoreductase, partial [Bradyrhizobium sp.]|nr:SDR family oxidoreductase [Bradyrhizobium sp.]